MIVKILVPNQYRCITNLCIIYYLNNNELDDDENDDEYSEVPDRETIKRHTTQMLNARFKTKQPKKIKKKRATKEEDSS